jgi:uncharacterized protein YodC (DUF2158 family)
MSDLKAGMKVRHKSGGPLMIVEKVGNDSWTNQAKVWCEWIDAAGYRHRETFVPEVLEEVLDVPSADEQTSGFFDPER